MEEFKAMAKLLAAIKAGEGKPVFCQDLISEEALCLTAEQRDKAALLLQKNGYIEGLRIIDGIDGQRIPYIYWPGSSPSITLQGLEYMEESKPLNKAFKALWGIGIETAAQVIANEINNLGK